MNKSVLLLGALPVGAALYFFLPKSEAATRYLVTGSSTVAPILQKVAEALEASDPELRIEVETGGSGRGIKDAKTGLADMGMSSRELSSEESKGIHPVPIAHDGIALIVHASNPVSELTGEQVIGIYRGALADWSAAGGGTGDITVINKAEGRSTLEGFLNHFKLKASDIQADVIVGDNAQGVRLVAGDPMAIGYVSIGEAERSAETGVPIKLLRYGGVQPSLQTVADGSYPIRRTLFVLFPDEPDPVGQRILDLIASHPGQRILEELNFVPLGTMKAGASE
jgi:phosphate transport system substrate-binding protein